ncbi:MAG: hypothetical protein AAF078_00450 [Planctomycetota bacterium]
MKILIDRSLKVATLLFVLGAFTVALGEEARAEDIADEWERLMMLRATERYEELAEKLDPNDYEVTIEVDEQRKYWVRDGRRVLMSLVNSRGHYSLMFSEDRLAHVSVITHEEHTPAIVTNATSDATTTIVQLEPGLLRLQLQELEPRYSEWYLITAEEVRPVSADEYVDLLIQFEVQSAAFDAWV